ncbi:MAG TPA: methylmalonyl Co-A mutase-associated GTPase MeaB [Deltaproteobacteria bacterium]|nr:MAG: GTPase [Deltaproteobacteria bacterium GWC2_65_14]HBO69318.1 methylmalonyl Co-A mutase-associated GTPase MeaB [Deltaproteobacteria bacterium]
MTVAVKEILAGNVQAAARLMRDLDDEIPAAHRALKRLYRHTGRAYILGVTGAPGAGKSTLVDCLAGHFRQQGKTIGIVAIDPTSPFTGGAILGDRIRMQKHALDDDVFIRSLATRGHMGGLSKSTIDIVNVMDAMGKEVILIETVGVGQDEVEIVKVAHTNLVLVVPGLGDDIQAMKAGILEIADIFVVNKADRDGADKTRRELETMVSMNDYGEGDWRPTVLPTVAPEGIGVEALMEEVERHRNHVSREENLSRYRLGKAEVELHEILRKKLFEKAVADLRGHGLLESLVRDIAEKKRDPYTVAEKVIDHRFEHRFLEAESKGSGKRGRGK